MECLSAEQMVRYLRGNGDDPRGLEAHVRDCPACAMELLLARETLVGLPAARAALRPLTARRSASRASWIPWAAAAGILAAALLFAVKSTERTVPRETPVAKPVDPPRISPPEAPKPLPAPEPKKEVVRETPPPAPVPVPAPKPKPETPVVVIPTPKPEPPKTPEPKPEPKPPAPTVVERLPVARVTHAVGGAIGRVLLAGDTFTTAKAEFVALEWHGFGALYCREGSRLEIGPEGLLTLHEGEVLGQLEPKKKLPPLKTASSEIELDGDLFDLHVSKAGTEVSVLGGHASSGGVTISGPATMVVKPGKAPEAKALEAGFAGWVPDKLASKKTSAWLEAEAFAAIQGFKPMEYELSSADRAAVQVEDRAVLGHKLPLPFKGRHAVWLRVRQYPAKAVAIAVQANGQAVSELKIEGAEGKGIWRWVGPIVVNSDRLDLAIAAATRFPLKEANRPGSFPVVIDCAFVTSDLKLVPAERLPEDRRGYDLTLEPPGK